ncbi:MAG TPA: hypothetical protein VN742_04995, partial [Candidatus Binataceae bacterium]|nr:hypothetical protein [Candidatus Binataceae bacterium]
MQRKQQEIKHRFLFDRLGQRFYGFGSTLSDFAAWCKIVCVENITARCPATVFAIDAIHQLRLRRTSNLRFASLVHAPIGHASAIRRAHRAAGITLPEQDELSSQVWRSQFARTRAAPPISAT